MEAAGASEPAIKAFERAYALLAADESAMLPEAAIRPVESLPSVAGLPSPAPEEQACLLSRCAILKLNGGLGTSMGLEKAKSLLEVRPGVTFLDLIVRQIVHFRKSSGANVRFLLLNSFSTSADTRAFLRNHPELGPIDDIELLQNKTPKIDATTLAPAEWPANPEMEWCPPGHGDLYTVLYSSGALERLPAAGIEFLFVSNSDNLGATLDPKLLKWFAESGAPFAMEVTARTPSDRKGGHLALGKNGLVLRESAQCPDADTDAFQDISRHRFFNTNNLWLRLDRLRDTLAESGGFLPLPVIRNRKTVDPRNGKSPAVYQLETAMGAAIECFPDSVAIEVPRTRFAPVKTTSDLLTLRSDAYSIGEDGTVRLADSRSGVPPEVTLDGNYKLVDQLEAALVDGAPSLVGCRKLRVSGPVAFSREVIFEGNVSIENTSTDRLAVAPGMHRDTTIKLP
jgi:UDP-glucose pyrophosphorylase